MSASLPVGCDAAPSSATTIGSFAAHVGMAAVEVEANAGTTAARTAVPSKNERT